MTNIFIAGYFSNDRPLESVATYVAKIVNENTNNKKYCGLTVQATEDSGNIADSYDEFHNLYGLFRQTKVTFGSAINLYNAEKKDKDHSITLRHNSTNISNNLSLFYLGPIGSDSYKGHYKHYIYPFETMFKDERNKYYLVPKKYVAYISQTHADKLLESYGEIKDATGKYSEQQYKTLLDDADRNVVDISIDSDLEVHKFAILNIYYESNYYYEGMSEILDDFIAVSYYIPDNLRNEQKNIYYLSEYPYQNQYFMNYINDLYSNGRFKIEINHNNIIGDIDDDFATSFYYKSLKNEYRWVATLLLIVSACLSLLSLFIIWRKKHYQTGLFILVLLIFCIIPYIAFRMVYVITFSTIFFTFFSCRAYFITLSIVWLIVVLLKFISQSLENKRKYSGGIYSEINI